MVIALATFMGCYVIGLGAFLSPPMKCSTAPPVQEVSSLVELYVATNGENWVNTWPILVNNSVDGYNPCALPWYGVSCQFVEVDNTCHVAELVLEANGLAGSVPSSLADLTYLRTLNFFVNSLTGTIPSSLTAMSYLQNLDLSSNLFNGSLPSFGPNMPDLEVFYVSYNRFRGEIPSSILQLTSLTQLGLAGNMLSGEIPDFSTLSWLSVLYLEANFFEGTIPPTLQQLTSLRILGLSKNNLQGSFPTWLCDMRSLQQLSLFEIQMVGSIPSCVGQLANLSIFLVNSNLLTGSIPDSFGSLVNLVSLSLYANQLSGTIPPSLTNLRLLQGLSVFSNLLTGTIPAAIGDLSTLFSLQVYSNYLTGSIPSSLGNIPLIGNIRLSSNMLSGSIPASLCNCQMAYTMEMFENMLTGTIPACIGNMTQTYTFSMAQNYLTGSIPASVLNITYMWQFELQYNRLTGTLPHHIGFVSFPALVVLMNNFLTGSVPPTYGESPQLQNLLLENNWLSVSLPELLRADAFPVLFALGLSYNFVHGSFPATLPGYLQYLDLAGVQLNGTVPITLLQSATLLYLDLQANALTGALPPEMFTTPIARVLLNDNELRGPFPSLSAADNCTAQYLSLSNNALTGRLPAFLSGCKALKSFVASSLQLTGPIEGLFSDLPLLQELVLTDNALTGSVEDVFAASTASGLVLNAAYNQLTGSLPTRSLQSGRWAALILTQNCLTGTLPGEALCANEDMSEVLLSGLHAAPQCRSDVVAFPASWHVYSSYVEEAAVVGTLPGCVLSLPHLSFVALSGNALRGSIPNSVNLSTALQGLDLSHNELTGSIPAALLRAELQLLDLSFNRLAGSLSAAATDHYARDVASKLSLQVNMLSGELPASWVNAVNIDVLDGNMFSCAAGSLTQTANSPEHDPEAASYACGSSSTNLSLLVVVLLAVLTVAGLCAYGCLSSERRSVQQWWVAEWQEVRRSIWQHRAYAVSSAALAALLVASMALYATLAVTTSDYADLYIWVVALSLQRGSVATGLLLVWLMLCTLLVLTARDRLVEGHPSSVAEPGAAASETVELRRGDVSPGSGALSVQTVLSVVAVVVLHSVPVFAVNMMYVYATTLRLSLSHLTVVIVAMALFKLVWNGGLNLLVLKYAHVMTAQLRPAMVASLLASVAMFNLIVSPILTESLVSPNCFQYAFSRIPSDTYAVAGGTCYWIFYYSSETAGTPIPLLAFPCMSYEELQATYNSGSVVIGGNYDMVIISTFNNGEASTVNFQAGFAYNFQCSFSLLEAFVHVFVYRYAISVFVVPALWLLLKRWQMWAYERFGGSHRVFRVVSRLLPPLYRLVDVDVGTGGADALALTNMELLCRYFPEDARQVRVSAETLYLRLVMDVAIGLSFGLLFPLLGLLALVGGAADLWTTKWMLDVWRQHRQRLAEVGGEPGVVVSADYALRLQRTTRQLEAAYSEIVPRVAGEVGSVLGYSALLWGFALYDILGRDAGAVGAVWVFVVVALMPHWVGWSLWAGQRLFKAWFGGRSTSGAHQDVDTPKAERDGQKVSGESHQREMEMRVSAYSNTSSNSISLMANDPLREESSEAAEVHSALHMS